MCRKYSISAECVRPAPLVRDAVQTWARSLNSAFCYSVRLSGSHRARSCSYQHAECAIVCNGCPAGVCGPSSVPSARIVSMARMIPLHIPVATESAAERTLFDAFEHACPSDWIVLRPRPRSARLGSLRRGLLCRHRAGLRHPLHRGQDPSRAHCRRPLAHLAHGHAQGARTVRAGGRRAVPHH